MAPKETDPLMIGTTPSPAQILEERRGRRRSLSCFLVGWFSGIMLLFAYKVLRNNWEQAISTETVEDYKKYVHMSKEGEYSVTYPQNLTNDKTFGELSKIMLPPWLEASLMSLKDLPADVDPSEVKNTRDTLLTTRDLLDVFSPVYGNKALFGKLRDQFKIGYETVGYFQDLDHSGVEHSENLWEQRRTDVLNWKKNFVAFVGTHGIRGYIMVGVTDKCTRRKRESHLFWEELDGPLPCGSDLASASLAKLAVVQLAKSIEYLQSVLTFDAVLLDESHQEEYHNLRKELRSFLDEYDLFGTVLLMEGSADGTNISNNLRTLKKARKLLGDVNDDWTAYHIYADEETNYDKSSDKMTDLGDQINKKWGDFKDWAQTNNLIGSIQSLLLDMD